jgi:hypothetical protein
MSSLSSCLTFPTSVSICVFSTLCMFAEIFSSRFVSSLFIRVVHHVKAHRNVVINRSIMATSKDVNTVSTDQSTKPCNGQFISEGKFMFYKKTTNFRFGKC